MRQAVRHRWRDYRTTSGARPWKDFIDALPDEDAADVLVAMREVAQKGLSSARHLRGEIYEVRADGPSGSYRVLMALEGTKGRILLALAGFRKQTQRTPPGMIGLAERRLDDWRSRRQRHARRS
ncbi:MAG TPA: type II toxin-antitoxin system RelE/ParE family toxin [Candidatus Limnocylindria bacterium]|nr:type II toxin-antitoxin system RelE/ParE family toxin [Candidatus Limnocylindria bacterium]